MALTQSALLELVEALKAPTMGRALGSRLTGAEPNQPRRVTKSCGRPWGPNPPSPSPSAAAPTSQSLR